MNEQRCKGVTGRWVRLPVGFYMGLAIAGMAATDASAQTGACCTTGVCSGPISQLDCTNGGGSYQGDGTSCSTTVCNDTCFTARPLQLDEFVSASNANATNDSEAQTICVQVNEMIGARWYSVQGTGTRMSATTCNPATDFDTQVRVWCGFCTDQICVAGRRNTLGGCIFLPEAATAEWDSEAGSTYLVAVAGVDICCGGPGTIGTFELNVSDVGPNDFPPVDCTVPVGACCTAVACVADQSPNVCASLGGTHLGEGTDCSQGDICERGACCNPTGVQTCLVSQTDAECTLQDGIFLGPLTGCTAPINPCPPINDECVDAIEILSLPFEDLGRPWFHAGDDLALSCTNPLNSELRAGVWYTFTPSENCVGLMTAVPGGPGSGAIRRAALFTGPNCDNLTEELCFLNTVNQVFNLQAGIKYWMLAGMTSTDNPAANIDFTFDCTPRPANDDCDAAEPLTVGGVVVASTLTATNDQSFDDICNNIMFVRQAIWYEVIGTGNTLTASTCFGQTNFDTKMQVWCGSCDNPVCVTAADNPIVVCPGPNGTDKAEVTWCSELDAVYNIAVGGFGNDAGTFRLEITDDAVACGPAPVVCSVPACPTCPGDTSGDNLHTGADIQAFAGCMIDAAGGAPTVDCGCADVTGDGNLTPADVDAFVNNLLASDGQPCS